MTEKKKASFQKTIYAHFDKHRRNFPWRNTKNPYHILVSEVMLQQTQTSRVVDKYKEFIRAFPTIEHLARAPLKNVLSLWSGMGYNRRALYLKKTAERVAKMYEGKLPQDLSLLKRLPGIGRSTAGAVCAFAYNLPVSFIETNIRSVFIHFFFKDTSEVHDSYILPLIEETIDKKNPREWYFALMDYGVYLKKTQPNPSRKSVHYNRQSPFQGSLRQLRGIIVKQLSQKNPISKSLILKSEVFSKDQIQKVLDSLEKEGFIRQTKTKIYLKEDSNIL